MLNMLKLNRPKQIDKQLNRQSLAQPDKAFPSGVIILSWGTRHQERRLLPLE